MKRNFVLFFFLVLSFFVFGDGGQCSLTQTEEGDFTIVCRGNGINFRYENVTNYVYAIANCDELKSNLLSKVDSMISDFELSKNYIDAVTVYTDNSRTTIDEMLQDNSNVFDSDILSQINSVSSDLDNIDIVANTSYRLVGSCIDSANNLKSDIQAIDCSSCSEGGGGGGSCCDFSEILSSLNSIYFDLNIVKKSVSVVGELYRTRRYMRASQSSEGDMPITIKSDTLFIPNQGTHNQNVLTYLKSINSTINDALSSLNNYAYRLDSSQVPAITNFVSLFDSRNIGVLGNYREVADFDFNTGEYKQSYHDFLTNYYIHVVNGDLDSLGSGDLSYKTNWFARVEALLAALVFPDEKSTNTVNVYDGRFDSVVQDASELPSVAVSRLSFFSDTSSSLVSSLRSLGNTFSSVADPGTVVLFNLPDSAADDGGDFVGFETSDIRNFVDVCRNVTTLAWVSVGLIFLFRFIFWTVRTSYSMVVFSWGVLSSIFSHN